MVFRMNFIFIYLFKTFIQSRYSPAWGKLLHYTKYLPHSYNIKKKKKNYFVLKILISIII